MGSLKSSYNILMWRGWAATKKRHSQPAGGSGWSAGFGPGISWFKPLLNHEPAYTTALAWWEDSTWFFTFLTYVKTLLPTVSQFHPLAWYFLLLLKNKLLMDGGMEGQLGSRGSLTVVGTARCSIHLWKPILWKKTLGILLSSRKVNLTRSLGGYDSCLPLWGPWKKSRIQM